MLVSYQHRELESLSLLFDLAFVAHERTSQLILCLSYCPSIYHVNIRSSKALLRTRGHNLNLLSLDDKHHTIYATPTTAQRTGASCI